jgi:hypothetical protein
MSENTKTDAKVIKREKKSTFPIRVKVGHTIVNTNKTQSNGCDQFVVTHHLGTKRVRKVFADLDLAQTATETVATNLSRGELDVVELRNEDRLSYVRPKAALAPTGVPPEMAAIELAEAFKVLEGSASVLEAVRYYAKMRPPRMPRKSVPEVVVELLDAKTADGASDVYAKDLRLRLKKFVDKFPGQISLITTSEVDEFLRTLIVKGSGQHAHRLSGRSGNN